MAVILLVCLAGAAILPAAWWSGEDCRTKLLSISGLPVALTRTPQPWLTVEAFGMMILGLSWAYYLLSYVWERRSALLALRVFCAGVVLLATAALFGFFSGHKVPFWPETENSGVNFGFFPNRNQTANVLALGGIMINALAFEDLRANRKGSAFWFSCLGVVCAALIIAYSRSGILLFFGGIAIWALFSIRLSTSTQTAAVTVSGSVLLLTGLFLFGGEALRRFQTETEVMIKNFRFLLQKDAWNLAAEAPWFGHGLGNFEPLFAMARDSSKMGNRALHPESDWMWAAIELGWLAPILILGVLAIGLTRSRPFDHGTAPLVRSAALVSVIGFALHGFVDVSGHRLGSLWPALFLMSLALHPECPRTPTRWMRPAFRVVGAALIALGSWWLASVFLPFPTSAYARALNRQIEGQAAENRADDVIAATTKALSIAPLDWNLYVARARAHSVTHSTRSADRDFAIARALEPNWTGHCFDEGALWFELEEPDRALDAWEEGLKRPTEDRAGLFRRMLTAVQNRPEARDVLRYWARENPAYILLYLDTASRLEFELESEQLLAHDPGLGSLAPPERKQFFRIWAAHRKLDRLGPLLLSKPEWQSDSWPFIARYYAELGEYMKACETVKQFAVMPKIPTIETGEPLVHLEGEFYQRSKDLVNGLELLGAQLEVHKIEDAISTLRVLNEDKDSPRYLSALEFDLRCQRNDWEKAWAAWLAFEAKQK
ncbi:MAG: O-antigen ligase family protein [Chthoniobacteraceae bacterium]